MNVLNIKWNDWVSNAQNYSKNHWVPGEIDEHFLDHLLPILGSIPLQRTSDGNISSTETFKQMPAVLDTPNGQISGNNVKCILGFLYYIPRGKLMKVTQTKAPRLAGLTPLPMYAQKLHNGIKYSEWKVSDPQFKYFLGRFLEPLIVMRNNGIVVPVMSAEDYIRERKVALTYKSGVKMGQMAKLTEYKCIIDHLEVKEYEDSENYDPNVQGMNEYPLSKVAIMMKLQLWLANVSLRDTSSMILDPYIWDLPPTPIDTIADMQKSEEIEVLPWN